MRPLVFLLLAAILPVLELTVIAQLDLALIAWYYIFFALPAFAVLAASTLVALVDKGRAAAATVGGVALLYSAVFLVGYFTQMHGDRPRWREAALQLSELADLTPTAASRAKVYASVPGVVAYYLGVAPGETMGHPLVTPVPRQPPADAPTVDQWYVVEAGSITPQYAAWFAAQCEQRGRFEAHSGPRDRSVLLYQRKPHSASR